MNTAYIYLQLYKLFDDVTPVPVDCGQLCDKACCKGDDRGMFLISKSGPRICEILGISKFTLYNYLEIIRSGTHEQG